MRSQVKINLKYGHYVSYLTWPFQKYPGSFTPECRLVNQDNLFTGVNSGISKKPKLDNSFVLEIPN